ncbi:MAG: hypothetical protein IPP32_12680 [Bacteroidetes bacterium]|nr:hypothetical protein [Bacteroidota bacterium]
MKLRKFFRKKMRAQLRKISVVYLALLVLFDGLYPTCSWALTGGPSQPEVQSFEPVGTSEMVDLFSGDFNYNIPLLDVDGYPVNISYHSGISMDQEASWVGLGWNINPGVINRNMRGIPDDFNGDLIKKEFKIKDNKTFGVNTGAGVELFGTSKLKLGLNYSIGVRYNNYTGISMEQSLNVSLSAGKDGSSPLNGSLGITSSSDDGLTIQPTVGLSATICSSDSKESVGMGLNVGTSFNSRSGLKSLTIGASLTASKSNKNDKDRSVSNGQSVSSNFDFGMPTYVPQVSLPMENFSATGSFKLGFEAFGVHPNFTVGGFYSKQSLKKNNIENPAYGYMNSEVGENYDNAILDFNREKDGIFTKNTPALPVTNFTYDIYSVSGQGVGGSYRPFRSDIGHVYDAESSTTSDSYSLSGEVGVGNIWHVGVDIAQTDVNTTSGRWREGNNAINKLNFKSSNGDPLYEPVYFKEANEKSVESDPTFFASANGFDAKRVNINTATKFNAYAEDNYYNATTQSSQNIPSDSYRKKRDKRSQNITFVKKGDLIVEGLDTIPNLYSAPNHHIAEITTLRNDGARYVYGIAAYNTKQEDVSFAIGSNLDGNGNISANAVDGLVSYGGDDNSLSNSKGLDNYYSNTELPPYAHSYLLTAVLSPDYIDCDKIAGPSDNDFGNYTKFNYEKLVSDYNWKVPVEKNKANYNEGLKSIKYDDKASYVYGTKELWYLKSIVTKNYVAVFELGSRTDANGVKDKNGEMETNLNKASRLLKSISLYSKKDYYKNSGPAAIPIKVVHFVYDYSLCQGIPNFNPGAIQSGDPNLDLTLSNKNSGKLTLRKIFFTYQNSNKGRFSPYTFTYNSEPTKNPDYNIKSYD